MESTGSLLGDFSHRHSGTSSSYLWPLVTSSRCAAFAPPLLVVSGQLRGAVQRTDLVKLKIAHSSSPSLPIFARLFLKQISSLPLFNRQLGWKGKGGGEDAALPAQAVRGTAGSLQPTLPLKHNISMALQTHRGPHNPSLSWCLQSLERSTYYSYSQKEEVCIILSLISQEPELILFLSDLTWGFYTTAAGLRKWLFTVTLSERSSFVCITLPCKMTAIKSDY